MNWVRLIPDDERIAARAFAPVRTNHLRPACAAQITALRNLACDGQGPYKRIEVLREKRVAAPQRKMRRVPPDHLGVMLLVPCAEREPAFRRRKISCALDCSEVL